jgi:transposase
MRTSRAIVYSEMATIQKRTSHGQTYWYIVESRRVNGKPRPVTLAYLGKAEDLLERLTGEQSFELQSYSHGDVAALLNIALELDVVGLLNTYIPQGKNGRKPKRDGLTVGATFLLAALGRACCPTSKDGWYEWCKTTSLEYCLRRSFQALDSQHFWDQMHVFPVERIPEIEEELVQRLIETYEIQLDTLLFDTSNFFTFIDSGNTRCDIAQRGKNKQKRYDLRQVGLALLVTRKDHFPLFHKTYTGNKNDTTLWREEFSTLIKRLNGVARELCDVTLVFDKGNNSQENFRRLDDTEGLHYVASLVPSYFKQLVEDANRQLAPIKLKEDEEVPVYRTTATVWGTERTCVVLVSEQLREGQIRGIHQALNKKSRALQEFKDQLDNPRRRKPFTPEEVEKHLCAIIQGQYVHDLLQYELIERDNAPSFKYFVDAQAFETLKNTVLGRRILVTNRDAWTTEEIVLAYRAQTKIESAFRNLKNPYHLAMRPQYHWTDQKIAAHFFICIIGYLLTVAAYSRAKKHGNYTRNIDSFMDDLRSVRLAALCPKTKDKRRGKNRLRYQLEKIPPPLHPVLATLNVSNENLRPKTTFSVYG